MSLFLAFIIVAAACSLITIRNLISYSDFSRSVKIETTVIIFIGWFGIIPLHLFQRYNLLPDTIYILCHHTLYFMLTFVFILFICLMVRDFIWFTVFGIFKLFGRTSWKWDPHNEESLNKANLLSVILSFMICIYATWQAHKLPDIVEMNFYSDKITNNIKILQISDLNLSRISSDERIRNIVNKANSLMPDAVVLTGDIIDDNVTKVEKHLDILRELSAPYGIFAVMGEHEFNNNVYEVKKILENKGITFLFNGGVTIKTANIFIAGIPDYSTMSPRINLWRTIYKSQKENYRVLLSHSPLIVDAISKELFDVVLSGHTLGGQFFPVHWFVKKLNHYLAGYYKVNNIDLFVSRGAGVWGPNVRLFAPADMAVINLRSK